MFSRRETGYYCLRYIEVRSIVPRSTVVRSLAGRVAAGSRARGRLAGVHQQPGAAVDFTEPAVLVLTSLADGPKHGYALAKDIEGFAGIKLGEPLDVLGQRVSVFRAVGEAGQDQDGRLGEVHCCSRLLVYAGEPAARSRARCHSPRE